MFVHGNRFLKQSRNTRSAQFPVLILIVVALVLLLVKNGNKSNLMSDPINQKWNIFDSTVRFDPTAEISNGTDLVWQIPDSPKAILFLAHGCNGKSLNFWDKSPNCLNCIGLPEERLIVLHALSRKFAVLAVSSRGICWSLGEERSIVKNTIQWWIKKQKLENLPVFALGASSGGYFVSALAMEFKFKSIALMIAEGVFSHLDITKDYPSTLFVHMPKDVTRKRKIEKYLVVMRDKGIDVAEVKCSEFPLTPRFFANRIPGIDLALSEKMFSVLQEKGFVDENGYMRDDGRAIPWKTAIEESDVVLPDKSMVNRIQEEMNLAFAYHEMTSLQAEQIFYWFGPYAIIERLNHNCGGW